MTLKYISAISLIAFFLNATSQTLYLPGGITGTSTNSNVGIGISSPNAKLDVQGQIIGGFGSEWTGGSQDWSHLSNSRSGSGYSLLFGNATNGPGPATYFHPFNFEYSSKNGSGNITQFAIPYSAISHLNSGIYMRGRYAGTWSSWVRILTENTNGCVGIGTTSPSSKLEVSQSSNSAWAAFFQNNGGDGKGVYIRSGAGNNASNNYSLFQIDRFSTASGPLTLFRVEGKTGRTYAREILLNMDTWADYVFKEDYKKMSLEEKEKYYKMNNHLVGLAPSKEIVEVGLNLGETMKGMTMNLEENSLEIIDLYKRLMELEKENKKQKEQILQLLNKKN